MRLVSRIRALFTLIVMISHSPLGWGAELDGQLGVFMFTGRFTRVAAAQQFDPTSAAVSRCPSRFVRRAGMLTDV
jgi:hypothetical protein